MALKKTKVLNEEDELGLDDPEEGLDEDDEDEEGLGFDDEEELEEGFKDWSDTNEE